MTLFAVLGLAPSAAWAQTASAAARLDSTTFYVGDPITVHLRVTHPPGATLVLLVGDTLGSFQVLNRPPFQEENERTSDGALVVSRYEAGDATLPPVRVLWSVEGDTVSHSVLTNELAVTVRTVAVDTTQDIKDLKPPLSIPLTLAEIALYAGIVVALALLGYAIYRFLKRRKKEVRSEEPDRPVRPAHVIAFDELAMLKEKRLWQQGKIKEYYSEATEILRRYFENRYHHMALEETTDEILQGLRSHSVEAAVLESIERILRRADLAKFAKHHPGIAEHEETLTAIYKVIEKTKVVAMTPVPTAEPRVTAHVGT